MDDDRFVLPDALAEELAATYGTPLYVLDEASFRSRLRRYKRAFEQTWMDVEISYASKANSILRILQIAHSEGYTIDVASEGEFRAALMAGVPAEDCHYHGNAKSPEELIFAIESGVGTIVIDNFGEIELLATLSPQKVLLRLAPGVDPKTHAAISTGQADTKFGFNISDGSAEKAVVRCLELGLNLLGFHCHVGSQLLDPEAQRNGGVQLAKFAVEMHHRHRFAAQVINVGGGLGVRYVPEQVPMSVEEYCQLVVGEMKDALSLLPEPPVLGQEPGRSVIAEAGVTLYRILVKKTVPTMQGPKTYLSVDGGLSDNPRSVMYGADYEVRAVGTSGEEAEFTVSGKHCETDKLFDSKSLPASVSEGDLLQVLCTGAYNASMASNYNRFRRPPCVLLCGDGTVEVIQKPETWEQLFSRES